jgi:phytoene synthase
MQDAFKFCEAQVRAGDRDRYLATLFAPAEHRAAVFALYAFNLEIARIREVARTPIAREIRLQWWRDVLAAERSGDAASHPVAAALLATVEKHGLERPALAALLEARSFDLYDEPMRTQADYEHYAHATAANLIALCAQILDPQHGEQATTLARHAGIAHAIAALLHAFAIHAGRGQLYLPLDVLERHGAARQDALGAARRRASAGLRAAVAEQRLLGSRHLARARELVRAAPAAVIPAFLPVALAPMILARVQRAGDDPFSPTEIVPWRRQWTIWRAAHNRDRIFR